MGRAKGKDADFAALLGKRRGLMDSDLLQAVNPSPHARESLRKLINEPTFEDSDAALATLLRHRKVISSRPLLDELANGLCRLSAKRVLALKAQEIRDFMELPGVRTPTSDQIFYDGPGMLHVCVAGRSYIPNSNYGRLETACGLACERSDMYQAARGIWKRPLESGSTRCSECEEYASTHADFLPDCTENSTYSALDSESHAAAVQGLQEIARSQLDRLLGQEQLPDDAVLDVAVKKSLRGILVQITGARLHAGGPAASARALKDTHWQQLRKHLSIEELDANALPLEDWCEYLDMHEPNLDHPLDIIEWERRRANARQDLFTEFAHTLGIKIH